MTFGDKILTCAECGNEFVFTAGEQEFFQAKGFQNQPKRCPTCRTVRRAEGGRRSAPVGGGYGGERPPRRMYPAVCASCGKETEVPFEPKGIKPVYCSDCFARQRAESAGSSGR